MTPFIADYDKAIGLNPNDANAYYKRGISKFKIWNFWDAIQDFRKAIKLKKV